MKNNLTYLFGLIYLALVILIVPDRAISAPTVINPGERHYFTTAEGGKKECRSADGTLPDTVPCTRPLFSATTYIPSSNFVRASVSDTPVTSFAAARIVTASVYNDFTIPGDFNHFVDAQISYTYDFFVGLAAFSAYSASGELSMFVEDITDTIPVFIAREVIYSLDRSGDQGFTDITGGEQIDYPRNQVHTMKIKLRRGQTYRISFEAQAIAESDGLYVFAEGNGFWNRLMVDLGNDPVEQLAQHDTDIKNELSTLQGQLNGINDKLDEINALLLTPQGRRDGFPLK